MTLSTPSKRVLCLHGSGGSAAEFLQRLAPLAAEATEWELGAISAPGGDDRWWTYPQGQRSFTASEYCGAEESIAAVEAELVAGQYQGILGFSQGAMLAAIVAARCALGEGPGSLKFAVMCSGATPKPYDALFDRLRTSSAVMPTLHCLSACDKINPSELGESVAGSFRHPTAEVLWHEDGHRVPPNECLADVVSFMDAHTER